MSVYEELVERCRAIEATEPDSYEVVRRILAEVLRTLETVTPEMEASAEKADVLQWSLEPGEGLDGTDWQAAWTAMLRASPLNSTPRTEI